MAKVRTLSHVTRRPLVARAKSAHPTESVGQIAESKVRNAQRVECVMLRLGSVIARCRRTHEIGSRGRDGPV
jgi:hypothetical protein